MTLQEVFRILQDRDARLVVRGDAICLRTTEPVAEDDPLLAGIAEHRDFLIELFTYAPGGRCREAACYRLPVADGLCAGPHMPLPDMSDAPGTWVTGEANNAARSGRR